MPRKILLIEDNEVNQDLLSRLLAFFDFEVVLAADGIRGLEKAHSEAPDIILMDMSLPELDGWEAARRLKRDETTQAIPIIAITAHAMSGDRERALLSGCDEYETKPVDIHRLVSKLNALLPTGAQ